MKKLFILSAFILIWAGINGQGSDSIALRKRLDNYISITKTLDFNKLMDYVHPSIFKLVPKEALVEAMEGAFNTPYFNIKFDSMTILNISRDFLLNDTRYSKVDYFASMNLVITDPEVKNDTTSMKGLTEAFGEAFQGQVVTFDKEKFLFHIRGNDVLLAIKDSGKEWLFLGVEKENPMLMELIPETVVKHFNLLK